MEHHKNSYFLRLKNALTNNSPLPGKTLVEIWGRERAIIERTCRILSYESNRIELKAHDGTVCVRGSGLVLSQIAAEQLVICGQIDAVELLQG